MSATAGSTWPRLSTSRRGASFLYNGIRSLFEQAGFSYDRPKGMGNCVMSTVVPAA